MVLARVHLSVYWLAWFAGIETAFAVMVAFWEELRDGLGKTIRFLQALREFCKYGKKS